MVTICPILNHPLIDGVLIEEESIVEFIQKRNLDFLPHELVCRSCKRDITKLYNIKLKRAIELQKSRRLENGSISSLKTSKSSCSASTSGSSLNESVHPVQLREAQNGRNSSNNTLLSQLNNSKTNSSVHSTRKDNSSKIKNIPAVNTSPVSVTPIILSTSISNTHIVLQENQNNQTAKKRTFPGINGNQPNVTIRKKTIKDYLTAKTPDILPKQIISHQTADDQDDVIRRLSQQPTTSNAANRNKRPLSAIYEANETSDDDDDVPLVLHEIRGTRLPNIQPIPPKRKPPAERTLAQDIMDEYIKDIRGG